jgi:formamidopyrimidine-DNA glycosylase
MPELPDVTMYIEALRERIHGRHLVSSQLASAFLLRSVDPPLTAADGARVIALKRLGKRIAIGFDNDMQHDPGGLDLFAADATQFQAIMQRRNHTLKRALTDPHLISGVGNAYSDEILHRAKLSPVALTSKLSATEFERLFAAAREVLAEWLDRLRAQAGGRFPQRVTAFHPEMAVHGRYGNPCPSCATKVQRIRYADNETNYCPRCQTGGRLLADRALSRLLKKDWPKSVDELEVLQS